MYIRIARIVNTFGIRGDIKVIADTDFPEERFETGNRLFIIRDGVQEAVVTVKSAKLNKGTWVIGFEEYGNINEVESFKNAWLAIAEDDQEELPEDEYYYHQIIGLDVYTDAGKLLGKIKDILSLGSNDVWVVDRPEPKLKDALIPYIEDVVKEINLDENRVTVELMEGLIDDAN